MHVSVGWYQPGRQGMILLIEGWDRVKSNKDNNFVSVACPQSDVNSEIDPTNWVWCYLLSNSNSKELVGDKNSTQPMRSVHMMHTQLTGFPLCAVDIWWRGLGGGKNWHYRSSSCSLWSLHDTYRVGVNQISKCARHCLSIYAATSCQSDTIGRDRNCIGVCDHIWSSVSL